MCRIAADMAGPGRARSRPPSAGHLTPVIWRRRAGCLFSDEPDGWFAYAKKPFRRRPWGGEQRSSRDGWPCLLVFVGG